MYPTVAPDILPISSSCLDLEGLALWDLEDVLALETATYMPGNTNSTIAHDLGHYHVWINDNGVAKKLDLSTFASQFPSYAGALLVAITTCKPWPFGEAMDKNHGMTDDGENQSCLVWFTRHGVAAADEYLEAVIDDYCHTAKDGFEDEEEALELIDDVLSVGRVCSLFKPGKASAHEDIAQLKKNQAVLETWTLITKTSTPDIVTYLNWSL